MRLSKQISIVYYGDQELLINRNCQNQLMFLQGGVAGGHVHGGGECDRGACARQRACMAGGCV